ncbi:LemA family protein [Streptococcus oricebi]|uniref:LemA family protein n=1 Tax=Streptococcus oricebi TaxID=1547447 RepID=A0ABS5B5Q9_9STRE|nr:LemA family protein [Streptococcus oricebi]MBP2624160.1 LemA family protein [Streptococcus oricebi]
MKNKLMISILVAVGALLLLGACSVTVSYNGLVAEQSQLEKAQADVETTLQRRSDLIGNLVESVKGQMNHETEVFTKISEARTKIGSSSVTSKESQEAQAELSSALTRLLVLTENYPQLKSDENVKQLMIELAGSENRILIARKDYNKEAATYNRKIRSFPTVFVANLFGFKEAETFKADSGAHQAPKVSFSSSAAGQN